MLLSLVWQESLVGSIAQSAGSLGGAGTANAGAGTLSANIAINPPTAAAVLTLPPIPGNIAQLINDSSRTHANR